MPFPSPTLCSYPPPTPHTPSPSALVFALCWRRFEVSVIWLGPQKEYCLHQLGGLGGHPLLEVTTWASRPGSTNHQTFAMNLSPLGACFHWKKGANQMRMVWDLKEVLVVSPYAS